MSVAKFMPILLRMTLVSFTTCLHIHKEFSFCGGTRNKIYVSLIKYVGTQVWEDCILTWSCWKIFFFGKVEILIFDYEVESFDCPKNLKIILGTQKISFFNETFTKNIKLPNLLYLLGNRKIFSENRSLQFLKYLPNLCFKL